MTGRLTYHVSRFTRHNTPGLWSLVYGLWSLAPALVQRAQGQDSEPETGSLILAGWMKQRAVIDLANAGISGAICAYA